MYKKNNCARRFSIESCVAWNWIMCVRLRRACKLLLSTLYKIVRITHNGLLHSQSYFIGINTHTYTHTIYQELDGVTMCHMDSHTNKFGLWPIQFSWLMVPIYAMLCGGIWFENFSGISIKKKRSTWISCESNFTHKLFCLFQFVHFLTSTHCGNHRNPNIRNTFVINLSI